RELTGVRIHDSLTLLSTGVSASSIAKEVPSDQTAQRAHYRCVGVAVAIIALALLPNLLGGRYPFLRDKLQDFPGRVLEASGSAVSLLLLLLLLLWFFIENFKLSMENVDAGVNRVPLLVELSQFLNHLDSILFRHVLVLSEKMGYYDFSTEKENGPAPLVGTGPYFLRQDRSEEHTSEL